jgi:acetolactate synthase I/III small subunit
MPKNKPSGSSTSAWSGFATPHPTGAAVQPGPPSPASGEGDRVRVLSVVVEDGPNTLTKVTGAIRRRGFHVKAISVGPDREPGRIRLTLQIDHGHAEADQVRKQLERVVEVVEVEDLTGDDVHSRELVVAKVAAAELDGLLRRGAKVLATDAGGTTVEFSGERDEVGEFVDELTRHGIVDVVRSGPVVMRRTA